ncbi:MAG: cbb3-type cytochrome c oxidase subunit II, partial [Bacteroidota bacterium]
PQQLNAQSIMPPYPWLAVQEIDTASTGARINAMTTLGVPYPQGYAALANKDLSSQASLIAYGLKGDGIEVGRNKQVIALIAYIQRLGTDITLQNK